MVVILSCFEIALPKEHLCEIMDINGSIHLTYVDRLFSTLNESTRLRKTRKSPSWDSTTLLLSTPRMTKKKHFTQIEMKLFKLYGNILHFFQIWLIEHTPFIFVVQLLVSRLGLSVVHLSAVCSWWNACRIFWSCSYITSIKACDTSSGSKSSQELKYITISHENANQFTFVFLYKCWKNEFTIFYNCLQWLPSHLAATVMIWSKRVQANLTAPPCRMDPDVEAANQLWFTNAELLLVNVERISRMPYWVTSTRSPAW